VPYQPIRVCRTHSAIALVILRPKVVQSKVALSPSVPDGSLTTTSPALEYQVGQAAASMSLAQMVLAGTSMPVIPPGYDTSPGCLCLGKAARPATACGGELDAGDPPFAWRRRAAFTAGWSPGRRRPRRRSLQQRELEPAVYPACCPGLLPA
jgi:hypothetical protein